MIEGDVFCDSFDELMFDIEPEKPEVNELRHVTPADNDQDEGSKAQLVQLLAVGQKASQVSALVRILKAQAAANTPLAQLDSIASSLSSHMPALVTLRHGRGSRKSGDCLRTLRHTFILLEGSAEVTGHPTAVLDPFFREQFAMHDVTPRYEALFKLLPEEFVGPPSALQAIVELMGTEMQRLCKARGVCLPPWRATKSLLTRWFPTCYHDVTYVQGMPDDSSCHEMNASVIPDSCAAATANAQHIVFGFDVPPVHIEQDNCQHEGSFTLAAGTFPLAPCNMQPPAVHVGSCRIRTFKLRGSKQL